MWNFLQVLFIAQNEENLLKTSENKFDKNADVHLKVANTIK